MCHLTHWGRVTQICVFNTRLFSLHNTLNYAIHGACLRMVLPTDVYRKLTSLWIKSRERAFKQFKSPVLIVLRLSAALDTNNSPPPTLRVACFYKFSPVPILCPFGNSTRVPPAGSYIPHSLSTPTVVSVLAEGTVVNCMWEMLCDWILRCGRESHYCVLSTAN
jgi:hypothetical protein